MRALEEIVSFARRRGRHCRRSRLTQRYATRRNAAAQNRLLRSDRSMFQHCRCRRHCCRRCRIDWRRVISASLLPRPALVSLFVDATRRDATISLASQFQSQLKPVGNRMLPSRAPLRAAPHRIRIRPTRLYARRVSNVAHANCTLHYCRLMCCDVMGACDRHTTSYHNHIASVLHSAVYSLSSPLLFSSHRIASPRISSCACAFLYTTRPNASNFSLLNAMHKQQRPPRLQITDRTQHSTAQHNTAQRKARRKLRLVSVKTSRVANRSHSIRSISHLLKK